MSWSHWFYSVGLWCLMMYLKLVLPSAFKV